MRYAKYKPTGIPWLPELTEGWEVWPPYASTLSATQHLRVRTVRTENSHAKWMRMTKVSKPAATRDLEAIVQIGALVPVGAGPVARYAINGAFSDEPIEGLNEGINGSILKLIKTHPGVRVPYLHSVVSASRATVERVVAALIAEGKIEHRGSKKTGGYYAR